MDTSAFLSQVRRAVQLDSNDETYPAADILTEATQALYERFAQPMQAIQQGYGVQRKTTALVVGQARYRMPPRAVVQGLQKLEVSGNNGLDWYQLRILTPSDETYASSTTGNGPSHFALEGDTVRIYPTPQTAWLLRMTYYIRPSQLVAARTGGIVSSATSGTIVVTNSTVPTNMSTSGYLDVIHTTGCNEIVLADVPYTWPGGTTITLTLDTGQDTAMILAGDVVRAADETDYVPLPIEMHQALVSFTSATILLNKGDKEKAAQYVSKAESAIKRVIDAAVPRVKTQPFYLRTRNTYLRRNLGRWGWR